VKKQIHVDSFRSFKKEGFEDCFDSNRKLIKSKFEEKLAKYGREVCPEWGDITIKIDYLDTYEGIDIYYLVGEFENEIDIYQIEGIYQD
jgi:hypothetical protein